MTKRIIGICGYKGSGKSEVAKYLVERHNFRRLPFAQTLKDMLKTLGLTDEQVNGSLKEVPCDLLDGKTPRWAMQSLGTEWGRACIDQDIWVRAWRNNLESQYWMHNDFVVDDLRFFNEAKALLAVGGAQLWRINRQGTKPEGEIHPSEAYVERIPVHVTFENGSLFDGRSTLDALHHLVHEVLLSYSPTKEEEEHVRAKLQEELLCG